MIFNTLKENQEEIVFVELKDETTLSAEIKDIKVLPILASDFVSGIKDKEFSDHVGFEKIIKGIVYTIGIHEDFKHKAKYNKLLAEHKGQVAEIINSVIENLELEGNYRAIYLYLQGLINLDITNELIIFRRANALENIYNENFMNLKVEESTEIIDFIIKEYEKLEMPLSYFRLAYIYSALQRYIKSQLYFEKFISQSEDEELKEAAREALVEVMDYANVEAAITFIDYGEYDSALRKLYKVGEEYPQREEISYLQGLCENRLGNKLLARDLLEKSIVNKEKAKEDYYNELAILYIGLGDYELAMNAYKQGIEHFSESYNLHYNRGILHLNRGNKIAALNDFKKANEIFENEDLNLIIEELEI